MKLRIAAAREGIDWLRSGARAFARQPVALIGLPLMLAALLAFAGMLPLAGPLLALALLPAGTVGLMEAARQATQGRFPSPAVLLTALRTAPQGVRQILLLGLLYALCGAAAEGLAWLLLGRAAPSGGAEAAMLQQAALAALSGRDGKSIASRVGLDELSLGEGSSSGSTSLTVGKRLSDKLYTTYEQTLGSAMGTLFIYYELSRRWLVRGQAGEQAALDVIYRISYD